MTSRACNDEKCLNFYCGYLAFKRTLVVAVDTLGGAACALGAPVVVEAAITVEACVVDGTSFVSNCGIEF
jgi:hypothetical protein